MLNEHEIIRLVLDNMPDLVFVKDECSILLYANPAFIAVYPPERRDRIIGYTTVEEFAPEEAETFLAEDRRALESGRSERVEEIASLDGRRRVFLTRKIGFETADGERRLLGISSDVTQLSDREGALIEANRRLEAFSALAAHDLRSPLATLVSAMHLVRLDRASVLSATADRYLDQMIGSATRLADTVTSLLRVAGADVGRDEIEFRRCSLAGIVDDVRSSLSHQIEAVGARLVAADLPTLAVDEALIRQLFQNLVENCIKYRAPARPLVVTVSHARRNGYDLLSIEDNGRGIPKEALDRVFGLFEQGDVSTVDGVGIGLALCRRIVELHGGSIRVDTSAPRGCRIVCAIPADLDASAEEAADGAAAGASCPLEVAA